MDFIVKQALGGATKDLNKLMDEKKEVDPKQAEAEREQLEALEEQEAERKAKHVKVEQEREIERQRIRDKYGLKRKDQIEAEEAAARERETAGRLTRNKSIPQEGDSTAEPEEETLLNQAEKAFGELQEKVSTATESCSIQ
ncbi:complexin-2-like [Styela clava]